MKAEEEAQITAQKRVEGDAALLTAVQAAKAKEEAEHKDREASRMAAISMLKPANIADVDKNDDGHDDVKERTPRQRTASFNPKNEHNLLMKEKLDAQLDNVINVLESGSFFDIYKLGSVVCYFIAVAFAENLCSKCVLANTHIC